MWGALGYEGSVIILPALPLTHVSYFPAFILFWPQSAAGFAEVKTSDVIETEVPGEGTTITSSAMDLEQNRSTAIPRRARRLMACGLNAHRQLNSTTMDDLLLFQCIAQEESPGDVRILYASWSTTILVIRDSIVGLGDQKIEQTFSLGFGAKITKAFGQNDVMLGFIDNDGHLYRRSANDLFERTTNEESPKLSQIALASNGRLVITMKQAPASQMCHVLAFKSFDDFISWILEPSKMQIDATQQHFMLRGRPKQLLANTGTFLLLMESGEVYSWGDPRYQSLGRSIVAEQAMPAEKPGIIDALGGLDITKIASAGWMCGAFSADSALYLWGTDTISGEDKIACLSEATFGELTLAQIPDVNGTPEDIVDVGLGDHHIAVLTANGRLFVAGDNNNGQLGVGRDVPFLRVWTEAYRREGIQSVLCGPKSTFVFTNC